MTLRDLVFVSAVLGGGLALGRGALMRPVATAVPKPGEERSRGQLAPIVARLDASFRTRWADDGRQPVARASDLALMRRLSLALTGSVPSLEEIRRFEREVPTGRVERWVDDLLRDRRSADYLSERFARALVGTEDGPFLQFRRRRFTTWLSDAILENRPYDRVVRDLVADRGIWTDHPATNFVTVTFDPAVERPDPERLAARVSRGFLGVRIDCAQCHDHPFQPWKQADFRGLAAFFGGVASNLRGVRDRENRYEPMDRKTKEPVKVEPRVPFHSELLPAAGTERERLAGWLVAPANPSLSRATVNRVWAILFGRPLVDPVDDIPLKGDLPPALDLLANDFTAHGYDLHRLVRIIAASKVFQLDSLDSADQTDRPTDEDWSSFPMTRLRPEQVAGAIFQAASLGTLGPQSPWWVRFLMYNGRNEFVRRFGDSGEDEFAVHGGTIPQRLLLMNGDLVRERTKSDLFTASSRIAQLAPDDHAAVEVAYLTVLTRRPSTEELAHFAGRLAGTSGEERKGRLTDLFWTLLNTTEFSWNH